MEGATLAALRRFAVGSTPLEAVGSLVHRHDADDALRGSSIFPCELAATRSGRRHRDRLTRNEESPRVPPRLGRQVELDEPSRFQPSSRTARATARFMGRSESSGRVANRHPSASASNTSPQEGRARFQILKVRWVTIMSRPRASAANAPS